MNEDKLPPLTPIKAAIVNGRTVRHKTIMRTVTEALILRMGNPVKTASNPASITFRVLNRPPRRVPPSIKLGGMT